MTSKVIPTKDEISKFVTLEIHKKGGHVGFIDGSLFNPIYSLDKKIPDFFQKYMS